MACLMHSCTCLIPHAHTQAPFPPGVAHALSDCADLSLSHLCTLHHSFPSLPLTLPLTAQDRKQDLVYLTADSPDELQVLDPAKIYILGGLVDRNRHKGICYKKAQEAGVATARFPITQHFRLHTSAVRRRGGKRGRDREGWLASAVMPKGIETGGCQHQGKSSVCVCVCTDTCSTHGTSLSTTASSSALPSSDGRAGLLPTPAHIPSLHAHNAHPFPTPCRVFSHA